MKILDRYISIAITAAFLSGVTTFMVLLSAMGLLRELINFIAKDGIAAGTAVSIVAYKLPSMLVYAFPMAMLLSILLTFGRMSSESEMVAIRAAGVSFARIIVPVLFIALIVSGLTYLISDKFVPYANKRSMTLYKRAVNEKDRGQFVNLPVEGTDGKMRYFLQGTLIEARDDNTSVMRDISIISYTDGVPSRYDYSPTAEWNGADGYWVMRGKGFSNTLGETRGRELMSQATSEQSEFRIVSPALIRKPPWELTDDMKEPSNYTSEELRARIESDKKALQRGEDTRSEIWKRSTRLMQRYATPFTCLVFALIGAPLGLRHHRTSSAMGLGVSLIIIFAYYFFSVYISTLGDSGALPPTVAAWTPNVLGAALGVGLIVRANK